MCFMRFNFVKGFHDKMLSYLTSALDHSFLWTAFKIHFQGESAVNISMPNAYLGSCLLIQRIDNSKTVLSSLV